MCISRLCEGNSNEPISILIPKCLFIVQNEESSRVLELSKIPGSQLWRLLLSFSKPVPNTQDLGKGSASMRAGFALESWAPSLQWWLIQPTSLPPPQKKQNETNKTKNLLTNRKQKSASINNNTETLLSIRHLTGNNYLPMAQFNCISTVRRNFRKEVITKFIHFSLKYLLDSL